MLSASGAESLVRNVRRLRAYVSTRQSIQRTPTESVWLSGPGSWRRHGICRAESWSSSHCFLVFLLAAGFGAGGIYYLAFGSQAHRWDVRFQELFFPPARLSWVQIFAVVTLGFALLCFTGVLYWLLR